MAEKSNILIVDDEQVVRESLRAWFTEDGYPVYTAASAQEALRQMRDTVFDILLIDIKMPGMDGLELQKKAREVAPDAVVIIMTAFASVDTAVSALKEGAYDYVTKPFDPDDLGHVIRKASERQQLKRENTQLRERIEAEHGDTEEIIGNSAEIREVRSMIDTVAGTDTTALITGESGTGKELVVRAIHRGSQRAHCPLVIVNCAGLPEGLIESELFGHEKGAFTGARYRRKGKFELADGGTIFFDEIGDISPKTQVDLLRVLEEKRITRVGGSQSLPADFRIIAATNRDLYQSVEVGSFRLDLYYRLNVFTIRLPPLRERREDIVALAHFFLARLARKLGRPACRFSEKAMQQLLQYDWPGNVRELENAIERAVVVQRGEEIRAGDLPLGPPPPRVEETSLAQLERRHIEEVLRQTAGNVSESARKLGIDRTTLYNKIRKYRLRRNQD